MAECELVEADESRVFTHGLAVLGRSGAEQGMEGAVISLQEELGKRD